MTEFDARHSIDQLFQLLAARLEPIIASRLAPHLGGLPWVMILEERDRVRGKAPGVYVATDPQAQLKVLTERLGAIGFPFDDHTRTVSVLGGELRIARNRWAHHDELTALDAWRTGDFVVRLLERLGDADGVSVADRLRDEAFEAVVLEKGVAEHATPVVSTDVEAPIADASFAIPEAAADSGFSLRTPPAPAPRLDFEALEKENSGAPDHGAEIDVFEPWVVVAVGDPEVIDELPKKTMKERVRAVAAEIVDYEGPIQLQRLARLTAASFGVMRLSERREKKIAYQIAQVEGIAIDSEKFVWPTAIDRDRWRGYRQNDASVPRDFLAISPVEVANAIRDIEAEGRVAGEEEVARAVLRVFGKSRLTAAFRAHVAKARKTMDSE